MASTRTLLVVIALSLAALAAAWAPGLVAPYQYDDYVTPLKDPASQSLGAFAQAVPRTLRPLTKLSYALESSLGVLEAPGRRVLNVLFFLSAALCLALLAQAGGLAPVSAVSVATLWAVHPVHGELLLALAGRSVLLSLALVLGSALAVVHGRFGAALLLASCAVLARETALPWLVVVAGSWSVERRWSRARVVAALFGVVCVGAALTLGTPRLRALLAFSFGHPRALDLLGLQWAALPKGLTLFVFAPARLGVDVGFVTRGAERSAWIAVACALYVAAVTTALVRVRRYGARDVVAVCVLAWLALVVPLHSVVPKLDALTARGVSVSAAAGFALGAALLARRALHVGVLATCALLVALVVPLTRERAALYADPVALWRDAAIHNTNALRPWVNLGTLLAQKGQLVEARKALERAVRTHPDSSEARERLGAVDALIETRGLLGEPHTHDHVQEPVPEPR